MSVLKCEMCGSNEVLQQGDNFVCQVCGCKFGAFVTASTSTNEIELEDGCYIGESLAGKPHGHGVCIYDNGETYEGNWRVGKRCGYGKSSYEDGGSWVGEYQDDEPWIGKGKVRYYEYGKLNGETYVGDLSEGLPNGEGTFYYNDGSSWSGSWEDGRKITGSGRGYWDNKYQEMLWQYDGEIKNRVYEGKGTITYFDGTGWSGVWKDDKPWDGEGTIKFLGDDEFTGGSYTGRIKEGEFCPDGEWHFVSDGPHQDFEYRMDYIVKNDVLVSYRGDSSEIVIPQGITKLKKGCFDYREVKSLICPESVKEIECTFKDNNGICRFEACGLTVIPDGLFSGCTNLAEVVIPNVAIIGDYAFNRCYSLVTPSLLNAVKIGSSAFNYCKQLDQLELPLVETIGEDAFGSCSNLTSINAPKAVLSTGYSPYSYYTHFLGCTNLAKIILSPSVDASQIALTRPTASKNQGKKHWWQ